MYFHFLFLSNPVIIHHWERFVNVTTNHPFDPHSSPHSWVLSQSSTAQFLETLKLAADLPGC